MPEPGEVWNVILVDLADLDLLVLEHIPGRHGSDSMPSVLVACLVLSSSWEANWVPGSIVNWHPAYFETPNARIA